MKPFRGSLLALACSALLFPQPPPIQPRIEIVQDLHLGELLIEDSGGSVVLTERNELQQFSGSVRPGLRASTREARILLTGVPKAPFTLVLDPGQPILQSGRGGAVRVESFLYAPNALRGFFNDQGEAEIRLGAKLDIPAGSPPGKDYQARVRLLLSTTGNTIQSVTGFLTVGCALRPMLHLTNLSPLDFGSILPGDAPGIFRVHANGQTSIAGGGGLRAFRSAPAPAVFLVTGTSGTEYCLELPQRILLRGPGGNLEVHSFEANVPLPGFLPKGGFTFQVGASLAVPAHQAPGLYEGIFQVAINYP